MKVYCTNCQKVVETEIPAGAKTVPCPDCSSEINVPEGPLAPGAVIGDFLLEKALSSGGMGMVYLARQISLDRPVALKVLHEKFAANQEYIQGLFHEARAAAKLTHPHIVQAYAVGEENGIFYFAMEYIRGETFKQVLKKQHVLDFAQAVKVIREICSALQVAWDEQKLVHQDIKPDNIMLDRNGFAKLSDLGLARSANNESVSTDDDNTVMGTPQYISPEQLTGVPTDVRSDLYSLGATFYQFVTGQFPYPAESAEEMARLHEAGNLTPPIKINPELPQQLNDIIVKMMARNIEMRYQTPNEVIADLNAYQESKKNPGPSVPKIKLNLNIKPSGNEVHSGIAKPPVSPAAPTVAKPGMPPLRPSLKTAQSAVKPTITAPQPAAPASAPAPKPAAPAPAPAPAQETPAASKPSQKNSSDEISLAPKEEKPKPAPEETDDGKKKGSDKKQDKKQDRKRVRERQSPSKVGTIITLILVPLLLVAIAAALFLMGHKGILGEKGKQISAKAAAFLKIKLPQPASSEKPASPDAAAQAPKPVLPPPPQTRPEFISEADKLIVFYRTDPARNSVKFLEKTEQFQKRFKSPVTQEETKIFQALRKIYALADEGTRARVFREEEIRKIQKKLDDIETRKLQAQQKLEKEAKEREEQRIKDQKRYAEIEAARKKRIAKLQNELAVVYKKLATTFLEAVQKNDPDLLKRAINEIPEYTVSAENSFLLNELNHFTRFLSVAFKQFEKFRGQIQKIDSETGFYAGPMMDIKIVRVAPPEGVFKSTPQGERKVFLTSAIRADLYSYLSRKFAIRNAAFFFEFLEGRLTTAAKDSMYPSGEWKKFMKFFLPVLKSPRSKR